MTRARTGNLFLALVAVALAELALNRVASRLFLAHGSGASLPTRALVEAAPFLFHLLGVLGLAVLVTGAVGAARRRELFVPGMRLALIIIGLVFTGLAAWGVALARLPERWLVHLNTSCAFLSLLVAAAFLRGPAAARVKVGVLAFALPGVFAAAALFLDSSTWFKGSAMTLTSLSHTGQTMALAAAAAAPLLLPSVVVTAPRLALALLVGTTAAAGLVAAVVANFDVVQTVALYGLHLEMVSPPGPATFLFVVAVFGLVTAFVLLVATPGGSRLAGYGLAAMAAAGYQGYQLATPHQLVLGLAGLLALALGSLRAAPGAAAAELLVSDRDWRAFVGRLASAVWAPDPADGTPRPPEAVVVHDDDVEITRIRCQRGAHPVSLRVRRRAGRILDFEAVLGEPGRAEPAAVIEPRGGGLLRGGSRAGPRVDTGDPDFDRRFVVYGEAPLQDEALRLKLLERAAGTISLWPGRAVRYRTQPGRGAPIDPLIGGSLDPAPVVDLVDTLANLLV